MLSGAVIGFGRMGITHYAILNTHKDVKMVAVCDSSDAMLKNLTRFVDVRAFSDPERLVDVAKPDFLVIATPTASHAEIAEIAISRGIDIFMEKPLALTVEDGQRLVQAAREREVVNQVGYFLRFCPVVNAVRDMMRRGAIGEVMTYRNDMYGRTVLKPSKTSWRAAKKMGGGCMLDFGSHCLDLSDYLFGPVNHVSGSELRSVYSSEVEDAFMSTLKHANGISGVVQVNWSDESYRRPYNRLEIFGTMGRIVADRHEVRAYLRNARPDIGLEQGWNIRNLAELEKGVRFSVRGSDYTDQLDHFIHCIQASSKTRCSFADALRTDIVIDRIREDAGARKELVWTA